MLFMKKSLLLLISILLIAGCSVISDNTQSTDIEDTFYKPYIIAVSDIMTAEKLMNSALWNEDYGWNDLFYYNENASGSYYQARSFLSRAKDQVIEAKTFLNKALAKLNSVSSLAPDSFFRQDVQLRINLSNLLLSEYTSEERMIQIRYDVLYSWMNDDEATYNITWDSYVSEYNDELIPQFNLYLDNANLARASIDLLWDQTWYSN